MWSLDSPTIRITPNSNDFDSTLNISRLYISSTERLNSKSMTKLKINYRNVTDRCASLKSCKMKASTDIGKNPSECSTNAMCACTSFMTVSIGYK